MITNGTTIKLSSAIPILNTRRMKTDLQTSENVFLPNHNSQSSTSTSLPPKKSHAIKQRDNNFKRPSKNSIAFR